VKIASFAVSVSAAVDQRVTTIRPIFLIARESARAHAPGVASSKKTRPRIGCPTKQGAAQPLAVIQRCNPITPAVFPPGRRASACLPSARHARGGIITGGRCRAEAAVDKYVAAET